MKTECAWASLLEASATDDTKSAASDGLLPYYNVAPCSFWPGLTFERQWFVLNSA